MADGFVQVPADSVGKKIDTTELTRADGTLVERERVAILDTLVVDGDPLRQVLIELRLLTFILAQAFNIQDDLDRLRAEIARTDNLN